MICSRMVVKLELFVDDHVELRAEGFFEGENGQDIGQLSLCRPCPEDDRQPIQFGPLCRAATTPDARSRRVATSRNIFAIMRTRSGLLFRANNILFGLAPLAADGR